MLINKKLFLRVFISNLKSLGNFGFLLMFAAIFVIWGPVIINMFSPFEQNFGISVHNAINIGMALIFLCVWGVIAFSAISAFNKSRYDIHGKSFDEKELERLICLLEKFKPARNYSLERDYHVNLHDYLKGYYPHLINEGQKGSSRPDLVMNRIAIEIKGPTNSKDLDTIASKLLRYYQHFDHIILVLFNLQVNDRYFNEWNIGIKKHHPNLIIVIK
ncbi:MAG: hypothetical protein WC382_06000 [Methanoregulaceae archaeon]|jgi:hypothetical protein